jgi:hypothetical protein
MQSLSLAHKTGLQSADTKLLALPRQQAGQFSIAKLSLSMLSSKQGLDSAEHRLVSPSQLTDSLTGGDVGLVLANVALQLWPAPSLNSWRSSVVTLPELQASEASASSSASRSVGIEPCSTDARRFMTT